MNVVRLWPVVLSLALALELVAAPATAAPAAQQPAVWTMDPPVINPKHTQLTQDLGAGGSYKVDGLSDAGVTFHKDQQSTANAWHWNFEVFWTPPPATIVEGAPVDVTIRQTAGGSKTVGGIAVGTHYGWGNGFKGLRGGKEIGQDATTVCTGACGDNPLLASADTQFSLVLREGTSYDSKNKPTLWVVADAITVFTATYTKNPPSPGAATTNPSSASDQPLALNCFAGDSDVRVTTQEVTDIITFGQQNGRALQDLRADIEALNRSRGGAGSATCPQGITPQESLPPVQPPQPIPSVFACYSGENWDVLAERVGNPDLPLDDVIGKVLYPDDPAALSAYRQNVADFALSTAIPPDAYPRPGMSIEDESVEFYHTVFRLSALILANDPKQPGNTRMFPSVHASELLDLLAAVPKETDGSRRQAITTAVEYSMWQQAAQDMVSRTCT